jgi:hypothetical protein
MPSGLVNNECCAHEIIHEINSSSPNPIVRSAIWKISGYVIYTERIKKTIKAINILTELIRKIDINPVILAKKEIDL